MIGREIRGHWFQDHFYPGEWGLRAEANRAEPAVVIIGEPDTLDTIEDTRSMHRLLMRRLMPARIAWQKAHGRPPNEFPDLGALVEWLIAGRERKGKKK